MLCNYNILSVICQVRKNNVTITSYRDIKEIIACFHLTPSHHRCVPPLLKREGAGYYNFIYFFLLLSGEGLKGEVIIPERMKTKLVIQRFLYA